MIFLTIDEILHKISREYNLHFNLSEAHASQSDGGKNIQILKPRPSLVSTTSTEHATASHQATPKAIQDPQQTPMSSSVLPASSLLETSISRLSISAKTAIEATHTQTTTTANDKNNNNKLSDENEVSVVLVTGCGSKIGCSIAVGFARLGLRVALADFDAKQIELVAQECETASPAKKPKRRALQIVADISQLDQAHRVIDRTIHEFGRLDVLVNIVINGGFRESGNLTDGVANNDDDPHVFQQYHQIIANNMHAVTYLCISAAPYLKKSKGSIVNVSHLTSTESGSYKFAYLMSKAGIATLTKCLATDYAPDIRVIFFCPKGD